jgi:transcriptional regulator with XRE-family HTH domain
LVKNPYIDANLRRANNLDMTIVEITGGMLRAARSLTGMTQQEVADRAAISRPCLTAWEGSSGSVPNAGVHALHRVVTALEREGVEFHPNGVTLNKRTAPIASTVIHSEGAAA